MSKYTFLDLAAEVLQAAGGRPMESKAIWDNASESAKLKLGTSGETPWHTLSANLGRDVARASSRFARDDRTGKFVYYLKSNGLPENYEEKVVKEKKKEAEQAQNQKETKKSKQNEKALHPLLAFFVSSEMLARDKSVVTKTINHAKSRNKKDGLGDWLHPDMVGFYIPAAAGKNEKSSDKWEKEVLALNKETDKNALRIYSFELKWEILQGDCRSSFFQAVANSSWAHEGYLAVAKLDETNRLLMSELRLLSEAFGIGVILLSLHKFVDNSKVLFPAQTKTNLDWGTINKLSRENKEFKEFIDIAAKSSQQNCVFELVGQKPVLDEVIDDPENYITEHIIP